MKLRIVQVINGDIMEIIHHTSPAKVFVLVMQCCHSQSGAPPLLIYHKMLYPQENKQMDDMRHTGYDKPQLNNAELLADYKNETCIPSQTVAPEALTVMNMQNRRNICAAFLNQLLSLMWVNYK